MCEAVILLEIFWFLIYFANLQTEIRFLFLCSGETRREKLT
jgi:hypothetical protein